MSSLPAMTGLIVGSLLITAVAIAICRTICDKHIHDPSYVLSAQAIAGVCVISAILLLNLITARITASDLHSHPIFTFAILFIVSIVIFGHGFRHDYFLFAFCDSVASIAVAIWLAVNASGDIVILASVITAIIYVALIICLLVVCFSPNS